MVEPALRLPAPAKLNLMLRVVGRRPDGYHLLQTVFQFIDRCDWISLEDRDDGAVCLQTPLTGVPAEADLTVRAAMLLKSHTGCSRGANIAVEKNLPMGGGLGGGSSDAATVLAGLNVLWGCGLSLDELRDLGLALGADVPVFLYGQAAWAEGVGEQLVPLELPEPWYLVVVPPCHVSTAEIFGDRDLTRDNPPITIRGFLDGSHENHCLPVVIARHEPVKGALAALGAVCPAPRLTGTGACVFGTFADEAQAEQAAHGPVSRRGRSTGHHCFAHCRVRRRRCL
ncbi:MAG: 4-(cytidine 5'-diphospho)-2-C-methyl-D-erythritol kinase [Gammaproteobacteria bacterium]|nr:4-(cytidine 5'-diphospho)-2-C-methyl-D-erythritol kinase [Gammaproteobacteria bacterium]